MAMGAMLHTTHARLDFDEDPFKIEVIMRAPDSITWEASPRYYHGGYCEVNLAQDGDLHVDIPGSEGLWHNDYRPLPNGVECTGATLRYKLQRDGNFITKCGNEIVDRTHSGGNDIGDKFLAIDSGCKLHIYEGTLEANKVDINNEIWSSDLFEPLGPGDKLHKGQILHGRYTVVLTPWNGNLEVREELSHGTYEVLWEAEDEWDAPPAPENTDWFAQVTPDGHLTLTGLDYSGGIPPQETVYFDKDLNSGGSDCFTLGFEEVNPGEYLGPVQPVAIPCDDRRLLAQHLRGST